MCDERTMNEAEEHTRRSGRLSRRNFTIMTGAAGLAALLPAPAYAKAVGESEVKVTTPDGVADCYFVHPNSGKHPGVLIWPDALGLRPAFRGMGKRLAQSGYAVLVVNQYYRTTRAPIVAEGATFEDPGVRDKVMGLYKTVTPEMTTTDAAAFVGYLDRQKAVDTGRKIGSAGYCMGGPMTIRTAATIPGRIGAVASFHGAGLVTDNETSPHLLIATTKASALIAIAENDDEIEPKAKAVLREAYAKAGLPAEVEVYQGAMHGWCPPDMTVYNKEQAERAWSRLLALFEKALA